MFNTKTVYGILRNVLFIATFFCVLSVGASAASYYVSGSGDDSNDGLTLSTPFKTIQKAAATMLAGDTCYIRGGTYRETVTPSRSGTSGSRITYTNYNGEDVTVSGADLVSSGWTQYSGNIYQASVTLGLGLINQVFVDGQMNDLARWPNNTGTFMQPTMATADAGTSSTSIVDANLTQPTGFWNGATVMCLTGSAWASEFATVSAYDLATHKLTVSFPNYAPKTGSKYYLAGVLGALDTEKEWYYDSTNKVLYLWKQGGGNPGTTVEIKQRYYGFNLNSRSYIDITGIKLFSAGISTNTSTSYCTISEMTADYVMHGKRVLSPQGGILLNGTGLILKNSTLRYSSNAIISVSGTNCSVINNNIGYGSYDASWKSNVELSGSGNLISHNSIYESGRSCFGISGTAHIIQYNDIYNAGRLAYDLGVIYFGNVDAQNMRIHHNKIHNDTLTAARGIYLDNFTENVVIDHNIVWNCDQGITLNTPSNGNLVYNNTLVDNTSAISYWGNSSYGEAFTEDMFGNKIFNNIFTNGFLLPVEVSVGYNLGSTQTPKFVNAGTRDYHLSSTSPAIDAGITVGGITDGFQGDKPDLGAYEYGGADWSAGCNLANPPTVTAEIANTTYMNLVKNGGFENGSNLPNWTKTDGLYAYAAWNDVWNSTPNYARANYYGVRLGSTTVGSTDGVSQTVTGLSPNTTYVVSAWLKSATGETIEVGAKDYAGSGTSVSSPCTSTGFVQRTCEFTTDDTTTTAAVYVRKTTLGMAYVYADVISLYAKEPLKASLAGAGTVDITSTVNNLSHNPDFPTTSQINIMRVNANLTQQNLTGYTSTNTPSVTYSSSNPAVIEVSASGMMTGKSLGMSIITVTVTENGISTSSSMVAYVYKFSNKNENFNCTIGASTENARTGYYSWKTWSSDSSTQKDVYLKYGTTSVRTGLAEFWFYDDPSDSTIGHKIEIHGGDDATDGKQLLMGFYDYANKYKYVVAKPTGMAGTYYSATNRFKGWHQVLLYFPTSDVLTCYIDGVQVNSLQGEHVGMLINAFFRFYASGSKSNYDDARFYFVSEMGTSKPIFTKTVNGVETDITASGLVSGVITGKITVANYNASTTKPAYLMMALYDSTGGNNRLMSIAISPLTNVAWTNNRDLDPVLTASLNVPAFTGSNRYIKLFVWDSISGLKPIDGKFTKFTTTGITSLK